MSWCLQFEGLLPPPCWLFGEGYESWSCSSMTPAIAQCEWGSQFFCLFEGLAIWGQLLPPLPTPPPGLVREPSISLYSNLSPPVPPSAHRVPG